MHPHLTQTAKSGYIVPGLKNSSLLSIGKLCDDHCTVIFTKKYLFVFKHNHLMLQGFRNQTDGLWDVIFPMRTITQRKLIDTDKIANESINYIIQSDK